MTKLLCLFPIALAACAGADHARSAALESLPPPTTAQPTAPILTGTASAMVLPDVRTKLAQFAPTRLTANTVQLPPAERRAMETIIQAARLMDPIFDRQAWKGNPSLRTKLVKDTTAEGQARLTYFDLMRGPWDRQDDWSPFAIDRPHPSGAGFYPEDMSAEEFRAFVEAHPDRRAALESLTTMVVRGPGGLEAVPYSKAYAEWLQPAAALLVQAAVQTQTPSLAKFLLSRAVAFGNDEYRPSDKDWVDLDARVEVTIGPYETYEDGLLGLKSAFEAYVTVNDPEESAKLAKFKRLLPDMDRNLPIPREAHGNRGEESPIRVVDLVFSSGDARKSVQTIAFNLPNDEVVRKEKGAKKVLLRNLIETKFDGILKPIGEKILDPAQAPLLSAEAFFDETLFHELSHSLGPAFARGPQNGGLVEVRVALGPSYAALEECKADVMGAYNVLYLIQRGELPKALHDQLLVSYFAGLFRSTRFGVAEAHGQGASVQINRFLEEGAARLDPATKKLSVDLVKLEAAIGRLVHDVCVVQASGDKAKADALLSRYGLASETMRIATSELDGIPVDVKPIYPEAGEK